MMADTIYKYKATFPFSKIFSREYEVSGGMTLFELHKYLTEDLEFAPDQMIAFKGLDESGNVKSVYGLFDMGSGTLDGVTIEKTLSKKENTLLYVFDIKKNKFLTLTKEGTAEFAVHNSYPRLVAERGRVPEQFAAKYDNFDLINESTSVDISDNPSDVYEDPADADADNNK